MTTGDSPPPRGLAVRVRKSSKNTHSSRQWLTRQLNDPYVALAKREGQRSRAVYKLKEIDERHKLFRRGAKVVDLGAAPGGWSQYAAERVGAVTGQGRVVALDLLDIEPLAGVVFAKLDFLAPEAPEWIVEALGGKADVVLSDMAANTTGHRRTDHLRIMGLAEEAATFARDILAPDGAFVAKVLQGGTEASLLASLKRDFARVKHIKPAASRADSAELYLLAMGFRGQAVDAEEDAGE
ncbi:23S rRNA Um-2552 2'-O-methyltransferase [Rhizobiales bacterium GAS191]|jgi:23S rRNA (uridine2552-2'-O)-methyltransferase|nr:23S rRNA Um-2552 2'-O-methyltransferase [Rhizobiales bacterium GAS191]SEC84247.1 23S rRNA Um-2552 2'-O-methyltransferase [Rhizobiales bacterium GAS188]